MKIRKEKALEDIFLDEIIMRVEAIRNLKIKYTTFSARYENNVDDYQDTVQTLCDIILNHIDHAQHLVKQEDNYKQIMLDELLAANAITQEVFVKYSPLPENER